MEGARGLKGPEKITTTKKKRKKELEEEAGGDLFTIIE